MGREVRTSRPIIIIFVGASMFSIIDDSPLYAMTDLVVSFLHHFRLYGVSAFDVMQWFWWGGVAFALMWEFIYLWNSGGSSND